MKKTKQTPKEEFRKLPIIPKAEWKFLWEDNSWDGPLSGILLYKSEMFYFMYYEDVRYNPDTGEFGSRLYTVHRLTPDILEKQIYWNNLFKELVGEHCTYGVDGKKHHEFDSNTNPKWQEFYTWYEKEYMVNEPDLDDPNVAELVAVVAYS